MKNLICVLSVTTLLVGCGQKEEAPAASTNATSSGNPLTAPVDYLGSVGKAKQSAERTVELASVQSAITTFSAEEGRYPKDLNELVTKKYLPRIPALPAGSRFEYDPKNGSLKIAR